jgi:hypothetical protein
MTTAPTSQTMLLMGIPYPALTRGVEVRALLHMPCPLFSL